MPIRPENKDRYPKDWPQISKAIREAAGNKCQKCGAPNGETVLRGCGIFDGTYMLPHGEIHDAETGAFLGLSRGSEYTWKNAARIVLTVAHLDHQPENCGPSNLRAWCQRCHNAYDAPMRRAGTKARARQRLAHGDLFGEATP